MHTLEFGTTTFNFNSDLSGTVSISVQVSESYSRGFEVPGEHLLAFVAEYVRSQRIAQLENASTEELLNIASR